MFLTAENIILTTMCVVWDKQAEKILLIDRTKGDWNGYTPPGGHIEFPESITDCTIREVKEETGLKVWDLSYKGVTHFVNTEQKKRFMVFNYYTEKFSGKLIDRTSEGKPAWIQLSKLDYSALAPGIAERLDLFFEEDKITEQYTVEDCAETEIIKI